MINLMEELQKLMKEKPLPYGRKPISYKYSDDGEYQEALILCSPKSIVWKNLYRDESEMGCYVLENNVWVDYKLEYILGCREIKDKKTMEKRPKTDNQDELWLFSIRGDYSTLLEYGDDVLRGDLGWTKETRYPPMRVPQVVVGDIYGAFERQQRQ